MPGCCAGALFTFNFARPFSAASLRRAISVIRVRQINLCAAHAIVFPVASAVGMKLVAPRRHTASTHLPNVAQADHNTTAKNPDSVRCARHSLPPRMLSRPAIYCVHRWSGIMRPLRMILSNRSFESCASTSVYFASSPPPGHAADTDTWLVASTRFRVGVCQHGARNKKLYCHAVNATAKRHQLVATAMASRPLTLLREIQQAPWGKQTRDVCWGCGVFKCFFLFLTAGQAVALRLCQMPLQTF